jgi:hypothetical protein
MATVTVMNVSQEAGTTTKVSPVSASAVKPNASWLVVLSSMISVAVATIVMWFAYSDLIKPHPIQIKTGYVPFAGLVVVTAALERLLEPVSQKLMPKDTPSKSASGQTAGAKPPAGAKPGGGPPPGARTRSAAEQAVESRAIAEAAAADPRTDITEVQALVAKAAEDQAAADGRRSERAILFWAIASVCGLAISGGFGFFLLQSVASGHVNTFLDLAVTGLAIGAGTKPLHDLITSAQSNAAK